MLFHAFNFSCEENSYFNYGSQSNYLILINE